MPKKVSNINALYKNSRLFVENIEKKFQKIEVFFFYFVASNSRCFGGDRRRDQ